MVQLEACAAKPGYTPGQEPRRGIVALRGFLWLNGNDRSLKLEQEGGDWAYLQAPITSSNLSPCRSLAHCTGDRYDVVCLWERPEKG